MHDAQGQGGCGGAVALEEHLQGGRLGAGGAADQRVVGPTAIVAGRGTTGTALHRSPFSRPASRRYPGRPGRVKAAPIVGRVRDITVLGAGPAGLAAAFWAGMRQASVQVVDVLP